MKKRNNFFEEIYDECGDIKFGFGHYSDDVSNEELERRYKIIMMTILPILLSRVRSIFFATAIIVGFLLGQLVGSLL